METSENINELASALSKAQANFKAIARDKTVNVRMKSGGQYTFSYAPLESILRAVKPALNHEGFALSQAVITAENHEYLETKLMLGAQSISNRIRIIVLESGPQAYGSALMYARRYGVTLLLCICADDDDDANAAEGNEAHQTSKPINPNGAIQSGKPASLEAQLVASNFQAALKMMNVDKIREIHEDTNAKGHELYEDAWRLLDSKTRAAIKAALNGQKTSAN